MRKLDKLDKLNFAMLFTPNDYQATLIPTDEDGFIFKDEDRYFYPSKIRYNG